MDLKYARALITGGTSALGEATAREFVAAGSKVTISDYSDERGTELASEIGAEFVKFDMTDEESTIDALENIAISMHGISVCVNCISRATGALVFGNDGPHDFDVFKKTVEFNLFGTFNVIRLVASVMAKNEPNEDGERGVIINTASVAGFEGQRGQSAYAASKAGISGMNLPLARDLGPLGIRVNSIAPGVFDTPVLKEIDEERRKLLSADVIFPKRLGDPAEFANLARLIAECSYINGETIRIDAGVRLRSTSPF
ncbi:MAG: SDR family NAD(P)-dependent oxidoreductase [Albidovulum sp.]|nr:SDR family NAD(P)-dependent oxidoreductase [Albidovulum sp.]MDE0308003.1 SDR family NAD(P)-dependent oxidoreductase [Albidovulum sp.]MDE0533292.1 SDR family NAD(P)-dependent oxidoreductase [Albidovulum sp.]